jgi:hypothetical protein
MLMLRKNNPLTGEEREGFIKARGRTRKRATATDKIESPWNKWTFIISFDDRDLPGRSTVLSEAWRWKVELDVNANEMTAIQLFSPRREIYPGKKHTDSLPESSYAFPF